MKYIITESQKDNLKVLLKKYIRTKGIQIAFMSVGGEDNFFEIMDINSPMGFLHLFDDLDVVSSIDHYWWTLYRYKPKHNLMIHNRKTNNVYINYEEIWKPLLDTGLFNSDIVNLRQPLLCEFFNVRIEKASIK